MIQFNNLLQNNLQDLFLKNSYNQKDLPTNNQNLLKQNETLSSSHDSKSLYTPSLKPMEQLVYERKSSIDFQYTFTNSFIQVQSNGNYNIQQQSGFLSMNIDFVQKFGKDEEGNTVYPFKVNVSLNFTMVDKQVNVNRGTKTIKPDIKKVIQSILNRIFDITKDGQNKSILLEFENNDTLKELAQLDNGKMLKEIFNLIAIISQMNNPFDKDGKRDLVKLTVRDLSETFAYEEREFSMNMTNINLEFSFDYKELLSMLEGSIALDIANGQ